MSPYHYLSRRFLLLLLQTRIYLSLEPFSRPIFFLVANAKSERKKRGELVACLSLERRPTTSTACSLPHCQDGAEGGRESEYSILSRVINHISPPPLPMHSPRDIVIHAGPRYGETTECSGMIFTGDGEREKRETTEIREDNYPRSYSNLIQAPSLLVLASQNQ